MSGKKNKREQYADIQEYVKAEQELANLKEQYGIVDEKKNIIDKFFELKDGREKHICNKKTYLWLCLLGAFGAHRFYAKQYKLGLFYLATSWCGFSIANTIIDVLKVIPMAPDENGNIWL